MGRIFLACKRELFVYYDEAVFRRFESAAAQAAGQPGPV
jgi:hypothetical protein